jgi:exodeoxyribonuclease V gamma subunit
MAVDVALAPPAAEISLNKRSAFELTGTLAGLRGEAPRTQTDAVNAELIPCLQLMARTGAVLTGKDNVVAARGHVLVGLWVRHLAGCAMGLKLTSVQIGVDGQVVLQPMAKEAALDILSRLAIAYAQAWAAPLPVACKTAWTYLLTAHQNVDREAAGKLPKDPHDEAEKAFDGGQYGGELAESAYLQRSFASYADLADELPHWAQTLYGDLLACAQASPEGLP